MKTFFQNSGEFNKAIKFLAVNIFDLTTSEKFDKIFEDKDDEDIFELFDMINDAIHVTYSDNLGEFYSFYGPYEKIINKQYKNLGSFLADYMAFSDSDRITFAEYLITIFLNFENFSDEEINDWMTEELIAPRSY